MTESVRAAPTRPLALALTVLFALSLLPVAAGEAKYHLLEIACALAVLVIRRAGLPARSVSLPLGLLLAWSTSSIIWAPDRRAGFAALLWILALTGIFSLFCAGGRAALPRIELAYLAIATPTMVVGLLQYQGLLPHPHWSNQIRLAGPFVNSNIYAAFVAVALVLALARAVTRPTTGGARVLAAGVAMTAGLSLVLTTSRGGWLAAICGVGLLVAHAGRGRSRPTIAQLRPLALAMSVVLVAVVIAAQARVFANVRERLVGGGTYSVGHRAAIYRATLGMIRAHPWGVGLAGYQEVAPAYRLHWDRFLINFAHSDALELVALLGIPGAALAAVSLWRLRGHPVTVLPVTGVAAAGSGAALLVLAIHSGIDFPLRQPVLGLYAAATLGAIAGGPSGRRLSARAGSALGIAAVGLVPAAMVLGHGETLRARADALAADSALPAAAELYRTADRWLLECDPANARALGAVNARLANAPLIGPEFLARAATAYELAIARGAWSADAQLEAAVVDLAAGHPEAARPRLLKAAQLAPRDRDIIRRTAHLIAQLGDRRTAVELEVAALESAPSANEARGVIRTWAASGLAIEPMALAGPADGVGIHLLANQLVRGGRRSAAEVLTARAAERWIQRP